MRTLLPAAVADADAGKDVVVERKRTAARSSAGAVRCTVVYGVRELRRQTSAGIEAGLARAGRTTPLRCRDLRVGRSRRGAVARRLRWEGSLVAARRWVRGCWRGKTGPARVVVPWIRSQLCRLACSVIRGIGADTLGLAPGGCNLGSWIGRCRLVVRGVERTPRMRGSVRGRR